MDTPFFQTALDNVRVAVMYRCRYIQNGANSETAAHHHHHATEVTDYGPRPRGRRRGQPAHTAELRDAKTGNIRTAVAVGRVFVMFADLI